MTRFKNMSCQELKMVLEECWIRLRSTKKAHPENWKAHMTVILNIEKLLFDYHC